MRNHATTETQTPPPRYTRLSFKFDDISFTPTREEYTLDWLRAKQEKWARKMSFVAGNALREIQAAVNRDRQASQHQEIVERELAKVQNYFRTELEKEAQAADVKRRAAAARILAALPVTTP